ncbi:PD-(D/E)XK motif protein [Isoptericola haloaureus]|uniref:PD-(D/E)XK motif protein n=1 Tax=Isoptericola haloaureus TaxID=1542902 RepID=A0ABU7ZA91_9MICO
MTREASNPFDIAWARLTDEPPSTETRLRALELDHSTPWGKVTLAIDSDDVRHLLVPVLSTTRFRAGLDGPGLTLRKRFLEDASSRTTYADLSCPRPELAYLFDELCTDVLRTLPGREKQPLKAVYQVIDRWQALFERPAGRMERQVASGLFAELLVLRRLLQTDASAHRTWTGPTGRHHDFSGGAIDIEVKATTLAAGYVTEIHGLEQLEPAPASTLLLAWFRLVAEVEEGRGVSLQVLAEECLELADDEQAMRSRLAQVGYLPGVVRENDVRAFTTSEERWYLVDETFPRMTRAQLGAAGVDERVKDANYTIDLVAEVPGNEEEVAMHLSGWSAQA